MDVDRTIELLRIHKTDYLSEIDPSSCRTTYDASRGTLHVSAREMRAAPAAGETEWEHFPDGGLRFEAAASERASVGPSLSTKSTSVSHAVPYSSAAPG